MTVRIFSLILSALWAITAHALQIRSVTPGTLSLHVGVDVNDPVLSIESGSLDARDFAFIADSMSRLTSIDISNCRIAAYSGQRIPFSGISFSATDEIPACAFIAMHKLSDIHLPKTAKTIGRGAFTLTGITSIEIPETIDSIADDAFLRCYHITEITLPTSLRRLGKRAFAHCTSLQTVIFATGCQLTALPESAFENTAISFSANLSALSQCTSIADFAFAHCHRLGNMVLPDNLISVGSGIVAADTTLESINATRLPAVPATSETAWAAVNPSDITLHVADETMAGEFSANPGWCDFNIETGISSLPTLAGCSNLRVARTGNVVSIESTAPLGQVNVFTVSGTHLFSALTSQPHIEVSLPSSLQILIISTAQGVVKFQP